MSWVRMDDTLDDHPKVAGCSDAAFRVWIRCIFYASRLRTDGVVPRAIFSRLGATKKVRDELLKAGLLDEHEDGVSVHDYLDFQESRKQIEARQAATRERVTKHRVTRAVTPLQPPLLTPSVTEHTVQYSTEQNLREVIPTCTVVAKDLTGQSAPEPPPVADDARETPCPPDLGARAREAGVVRDFCEHYRVTEAQVLEAVSEFAAYWTIGGGMGQKRRHWMRLLRQRLKDQCEQGKLKPIGAIEHAEQQRADADPRHQAMLRRARAVRLREEAKLKAEREQRVTNERAQRARDFLDGKPVV